MEVGVQPRVTVSSCVSSLAGVPNLQKGGMRGKERGKGVRRQCREGEKWVQRTEGVG